MISDLAAVGFHNTEEYKGDTICCSDMFGTSVFKQVSGFFGGGCPPPDTHTLPPPAQSKSHPLLSMACDCREEPCLMLGSSFSEELQDAKPAWLCVCGGGAPCHKKELPSTQQGKIKWFDLLAALVVHAAMARKAPCCVLGNSFPQQGTLLCLCTMEERGSCFTQVGGRGTTRSAAKHGQAQWFLRISGRLGLRSWHCGGPSSVCLRRGIFKCWILVFPSYLLRSQYHTNTDLEISIALFSRSAF